MDIASFLNGFTATESQHFMMILDWSTTLTTRLLQLTPMSHRFFVGQESPLEWRGKTLFIELVANCPGKGPESSLPVHLHPGDHSPPGATCLMNWPFTLYLLVSHSNFGFPCPAMTIRSSNHSRSLLRPDDSPNGLQTPRFTVTRMLLLDHRTADSMRGVSQPFAD